MSGLPTKKLLCGLFPFLSFSVAVFSPLCYTEVKKPPAGQGGISMLHTRFTALLLAVVLALGLTGCTGGDSPAQEQ